MDTLRAIYPAGEAEAITAMVFLHFAKIEKSDIIRHPEKEISLPITAKLDEALLKLQAHVPVQYVIGSVNFCGIKFGVSNAALIPRPETEEMTRLIINSISENSALKILDIGTGSGCIPISIKHYCPNAKVYAIEKSEQAIALAIKNSVLAEAQVEFLNIDFLDEANWENLSGFDMIVSNPPYISAIEEETLDKNVTLHEPHLALFVPNNDPLIFYRKIAAFALTRLNKNGEIWLELNTALANQTKKLFEDQHFEATLIKDQFENDRFLKLTHRYP